MLASGHIPVSNPEINQQPEITQSETSQPVNTQLQTSTDDLSTFTPVYKENVDLHNEIQPSYPYQYVNTQTSTDNSTMFTPVYSENVDMPDVDFDNQPYDQLFEGDYNPALDGESGERLLGYVETNQNIKPRLVNNKHVFEKVTEIEGPTTTTNQPPTRPADSTDSKLDSDLGVDWDQSFHTRCQMGDASETG